jgi:hypothetical protein
MIETVSFDGSDYPAFQTNGFAARFIMPFAMEVCKGEGIDVGCNRMEWKLPGAHPVDPEINQYHATDFPYSNMDYVFSSHCLEHVPDWVGALEYWTDRLKPGVCSSFTFRTTHRSTGGHGTTGSTCTSLLPP